MKSPEYLACVEWLKCSCGRESIHGIVRLFEGPFSAPAPDGMPAQAWVWTCNFEMNRNLIIIKAAQTAPPSGSVKTMLDLGRRLGANKLQWQRCEHGGLRIVEFDLAEESVA